MSKRYEKAAALVEPEKSYPLGEAITVLKSMPPVKFDETVELSISLGIDPAKSDQAIRGTVILPHGTGRTRRVLVFCKGEHEILAKQAGADFVGGNELIDKVQQGWLEFDVAIATPELMKDVSRLGKLLGPRGLMPNPKAGTVSNDVARAVTEVKQGKVEFKMDKLANLHVVVGKVSFAAERLLENAKVVLEAILRSRPSAVKGTFVRRVALASTMSPGITVDLQPFVEREQE